MAGHSHWKQIKVKKASSDRERGRNFSKLLNAVSIAAREEPNPDFNPRLRATIQKAREAQVPQENIGHAIERAKEDSASLTELIMEAFGPGGASILIEAITDSSNRTVNETKQILRGVGAKWAEPGSVRWSFEPPSKDSPGWRPKFKKELNEIDKDKLRLIVGALGGQNEIQEVHTNVDL
ncbi:MAG: YebC/PmpR family DNA-binding transcriptional regulator [Minisyncoccia bacterium]|jgi:transcriptional/translational regulatory protein YebC/TACO1